MTDDLKKIRGNICRKHNCSWCCYETEMPLTIADMMRITQKTGLTIEEYTRDKDGLLVLRNVREGDKKHCIFLKEGLCSIYSLRPKGCQLYPLIWDLNEDKAILDPDCPYHDRFKIDKKSLEKILINHVKELLG